MDRWSNEDSFERGPRGPAGNVARLGIGGFVASTSSAGAVSWVLCVTLDALDVTVLRGSGAGQRSLSLGLSLPQR